MKKRVRVLSGLIVFTMILSPVSVLAETLTVTGTSTTSGYTENIIMSPDSISQTHDITGTYSGSTSGNSSGSLDLSYTQGFTSYTGTTSVPETKTNYSYTITGDLFLKNTYRVAEVYSVNNNLSTALWQPALTDLPDLEAFVYESGNYANVYSASYNLPLNHEVYKPYEWAKRPCEILGYDYLLQAEGFDGTTHKVAFTNEQAVSWRDALQGIYKAMGQEIYTYQLSGMSSVSFSDKNSPAVQNLDSLYGVQGYRVNVFATRSNYFENGTPHYVYDTKAVADNIIGSAENTGREITGADFVTLCASLMEMYGEPVYSDSETNALLQVYGLEVPTAYGQGVAKAWMYLKARGVLNVDLDMSGTVSLEDMLDVLMCIKDPDSRTDYKEIQLTASIDDDLTADGYFNVSNLTVKTADSALSVTSDIDYTNTIYHDYFIKYADNVDGNNHSSIFKKTTSAATKDIFIAQTVNQNKPSPWSKVIGGRTYNCKYLGVENLDGKNYYHVQIPDIYFDGNTASLNTSAIDDAPYYIVIPKGGGIYDNLTYTAQGSGYYLTAQLTSTFDQKESKLYAEYVDSSRANNGGITVSKSFFEKVADFFMKPIVVQAATGSTDDAKHIISLVSTSEDDAQKLVDIYNLYQVKLKGGMTQAQLETECGKIGIKSSVITQAYNISISDVGTAGYYTVKKLTIVAGQNQSVVMSALNCFAKFSASTLAANNVAAPTANSDISISDNNLVSGTDANTFATSAIMNAVNGGDNFDCLIAYSDLRKNAIVDQSKDMPMPDSNGILELQTSNFGVVKINNTKKTILVGTVLYDFSSQGAVYAKSCSISAQGFDVTV